MRRWSLFFALAATLSGATLASAGSVGFVDVERALATVEQGKAKLKELEAWSKPRLEALEKLRVQHDEAQRLLVQQRQVASVEARARLEEAELSARRQLEDGTRDYQREFDAKQTDLLREVARNINTVVSEHAEANGFDAIFIMKDRTLIYLAPASDLTETIIKVYNQRFPAATGG